jgi:TolB protein
MMSGSIGRSTFWLIAVCTASGCDGTAPEGVERDEIVYHAPTVGLDADLFAIPANGGPPRQLTTSPGYDFFAAVSPDGQRVAFRKDHEGVSEIYVINADGTGERRITNLGFANEPAWAPDGQRLIFSANSELYTVDVDGNGLTQLTNNTVADGSAHWSPDGTKIALVRETAPSRLDVYVMNSDGTNPVRLTESHHSDFAPRWSPDGRRIAFIADTAIAPMTGGNALAVIDAAGSPRELLTPFTGAAIDGFTWSRDGARIIFSRLGDLWSLNVGDKSVTRLTDTPAIDERGPSWRRVP